MSLRRLTPVEQETRLAQLSEIRTVRRLSIEERDEEERLESNLYHRQFQAARKAKRMAKQPGRFRP